MGTKTRVRCPKCGHGFYTPFGKENHKNHGKKVKCPGCKKKVKVSRN